ncbi:hypothetical protein AKJ16_DCAP21540 [Drosera capensis]
MNNITCFTTLITPWRQSDVKGYRQLSPELCYQARGSDDASVRSHYKCRREDGKATDQGDANKDYSSDVPRRNCPNACR